MPGTSRDTASDAITLDGLDVRMEHLDGGYSVCFESHTADAVEFSPTDVLGDTIGVVMGNLRASGAVVDSARS